MAVVELPEDGQRVGLFYSSANYDDAVFDRPFGTAFRRPSFRGAFHDGADWAPEIDVFERDNRLVTKVDLPGMRKEDVTVEVTDDGRFRVPDHRFLDTGAALIELGVPVVVHPKARSALEAAGWRVVTVWECAMKAPDFGDRLVAAVRGQAGRPPTRARSRSTSQYAAGTTISVRNVELSSPPITTVPSSAAMIDPSLSPAASGTSARIVASAVIRIGRTRVCPPRMSASLSGTPCWIDEGVVNRCDGCEMELVISLANVCGPAWAKQECS